MQVNEQRRSVPHFLVGVDFSKIQTSSTDHTTAMVGLGAQPPQTQPFLAIGAWAFSYVRFALGTARVSLGHLLIYLALAATVFFIVATVSEYKIWTTDLGGYNPLLTLLDDAHRQYRVFALNVFLILATTFLLIFLLNYTLDFFYRLHVYDLPIPTSLKYQPWVVKRYLVEPWNIHFGLMNVRYGYNNDSFFVVSETNHLAMIVDFAILEFAGVYRGATAQWFGNHATPPVRVVLGRGSHTKTIVMIHGKYFEEDGPGLSKAQAFADGLNAKVQQSLSPPKSDVAPPH